jgi:uncharacterized protein YqhQ
MDDNIDCSTDITSEKEAFSAGYEAGWKARGEYIRDCRNARSGTGFGLALMLIGGMFFAAFAFTSFFMAVVIERVVVAAMISLAVAAVGYFINKLESKSYNKKQAEFKDKWGD